MEIDNILKDRRETILHALPPRRTGRTNLWFQSAWCAARADSDVDILVKLEAGRSLLDLIAI